MGTLANRFKKKKKHSRESTQTQRGALITRRSGLKHPFLKLGALLNKSRTPEHSVLSLPITRQLHVYGWDFENELRTFSFLPSSSFRRLLQSSRLSFSISFILSFAPHRRDLHTNTTHLFVHKH